MAFRFFVKGGVMSQKTLYYAQLAEDTARRLTGNWERWAGFLATAGRLYKYPYPDQLMIYAQCPGATACASYDVWNDRMNRYVRRGSKGIALLDDAGDRLRLRYVFDLADTGTRQNSRDPWLWTLEDRHRIPVAAMLERRYGTAATDLPQQFADAAGTLADAYWAGHGQEISGILANSMLEEYDELNRGLAFKRAVTASTTFALLSRCGYAPENRFGAEDFRNIYEFNTPAIVAALGTAVSEGSREVLLQIAAVVRQVEREIAEERRLWDEQHEYRVQAQRGLSDPEHRTEPAADASGQVRADAPDVSQGEPAGPLQSPAPERDAVPAPGGERGNGPAASRTDDARADADGGRDGGLEGPRPDKMGGTDERLQSAGRGSDPERTDLQLSFFATEAEQIAQIDQRAEAEKVSAFSFSEADWRAALASGSGFENGKARIAAYYAGNHSAKERTAFLKREYGTGGRSWTFQDGSNGFLDYDTSGIKLRSYPKGQEQRLKWLEVEKRIHVLITMGQYLDGPEQTVPDEKDTRTEGEILREKLAERGIVNGQLVDPEKLDSDPFIRQVVADAEATKETVSAQFQKTLTAEDVTDIRLKSSSYSAVSREKEYHLSCKINGAPDTLVYTVSQHDDGEGFSIRSGQREEDDIWKKMPQPELEKLEAVLARAVEFDYWSKSIEHAADADALEVVTLDYRWAEDLNLSSEQRSALWEQIEDRKAQLTTQPAIPTEPMAAYPAEETHLPYDVVVERLHVDQPQPEIPAPPARNRSNGSMLSRSNLKFLYHRPETSALPTSIWVRAAPSRSLPATSRPSAPCRPSRQRDAAPRRRNKKSCPSTSAGAAWRTLSTRTRTAGPRSIRS